ncbi:MAG: hypothetical protein ACR2M8_08610 [Pyrinomonadaceae bacterium]
MQKVNEIYKTSILPLGESEKLELASLILEEVAQSRKGRQISVGDKTKARQRLREFAGRVSGGNPNASDNEKIDKDLAAEYLNTHEDDV